MLASAVARNYFKLLAYKDEYEVARLYTKTPFLKDACAEFEGKPKLKFYLSPPIFSQFDHETGRPRKYEFGAWVLPVFKLLATLKFFRGTFLDPFKYSAERRANEQLVSDYEDLIWRFVNELTPKRMQLAIQLANLPQSIRGYGPIRSASIHSVEILRDELLGLWDKPDSYDSSRGNRA